MNLLGMKGWTVQRYSKRPALETVKVLVPLAKRPVSKELSVAVTVCSAESLFSTVTVSPTFTCRVSGANSKLEMVMVEPPPAAPPAAEVDPPSSDPPQAVARARADTAATRLRRTADGRCAESVICWDFVAEARGGCIQR